MLALRVTLLAAVVLSVSAAKSKCRPKWRKHGPNCYRVYKTLKNIQDAETKCENANAKLVTISSDSENNFVAGLVGDNQAWTGFRMDPGGSEAWQNGAPITYTKWKPKKGRGKKNAPLGNRKQCGYIDGRKKGMWGLASCIRKKRWFVCFG